MSCFCKLQYLADSCLFLLLWDMDIANNDGHQGDEEAGVIELHSPFSSPPSVTLTIPHLVSRPQLLTHAWQTFDRSLPPRRWLIDCLDQRPTCRANLSWSSFSFPCDTDFPCDLPASSDLLSLFVFVFVFVLISGAIFPPPQINSLSLSLTLYLSLYLYLSLSWFPVRSSSASD